MYDAYLFDWDGCLANTLSIWMDAYQEIFKHEGKEISIREIGQKVFGNFNYATDYDLHDQEFMHQKYDEVYAKMRNGVELNTGAAEMLLGLKRAGAKLALVTSSDREGVQKTLEETRIITLFSAIVTAEDTLLHKPHPEPLQLAIAQLGVEPAKTAMVGDTYNDMFPAKELGISCILYHHIGMHDVFYDMDSQIKQYPPDHIVANLEEILDL